MERETCAFEEWLSTLQKDIEKEDLIPALSRMASAIFERYRVRVWFAEILGKRWSYIAGEGGDTPLPLFQVVLSPRFGFAAERWSDIPSPEREILLVFLQEFVHTRTASSKKES